MRNYNEKYKTITVQTSRDCFIMNTDETSTV